MSALYTKITTTANPQTVTLTTDAVNQNQNILVREFDLTAGSCVLALPALSTIFVGSAASNGGNNGSGGGGVSFRLQGNIVAGAFPKTLTLLAYTAEGNVDTICGDASVVLNGVATSFSLEIVGLHTWMLTTCSATTFS